MPNSLLFASERGLGSTASPIRKFHFRTTDPDEFAEHISPVSQGIAAQATAAKFETTVDAVKLPLLGLFSVRMRNLRVNSFGSRRYLSLTVPLDNPLQISDRSGTQEYVKGDAHLLHTQDPFDLFGTGTTGSANVLVANLDEEILRSYGQCLEPERDFDLERLVRRISFATPEGSSLWRHLALIWSQIGRAGALARSPLALREIELSLVALLILAADVDSQNVLRSGNGGTSVAQLRKAEEYMEAHVRTPVSLAELARAVGVSTRTLFRAFKKHHGSSPMAFLKQRRLESAQRSLLAAEPRNTTVSAVAADYGFFHFGRFAEDYQRAFKEKPSDTLRR